MDLLQNGLSLISTNRHIQALLVVLGAALVAKIVDWLLTRVIKRITRRTKSDVDDQILALLHRPVFATLLLVGVWMAVLLEQPSVNIQFVFSGLIRTVIVLRWLRCGFQLTAVLLRWVTAHPERFRMVQPSTEPLFEIGTKSILLAAAIYFFLVFWGINPAGWLTSAGIVGIAVGFAAKDTLANLFAGVSILADAPYKVGDFIQLDEDRGQVIRIGLRSTRILTRDDIEITIPNSTIANAKIVNESGGPSVKHRVRIPIGVAYGADVDRLREILIEIATSDDLVCTEPEPRVRFRTFGESSLDFELLCWINNPQDRGRTTDSLNTKIYKTLGSSGIEIPFPQRDVYIKHLPPVKQDDK